MNNPSNEENAPSSGAKKRGRPKGSKNKPREVIHTIPAGCPKCGSSEFTDWRIKKEWPRPNAPAPPYPVKGRRFGRIRWSYARCSKCNHFLNVVQHLDEIIV